MSYIRVSTVVLQRLADVGFDEQKVVQVFLRPCK
jgi:hypothetical protein